MKKIIKMALVGLALFTAGCLNCYVRCPFTDAKITDTYQSTRDSFVYSYVIMFPQVMSPDSTNGFYPENIITVPIGCLCFIDVACEGVLDTIFWPIDRWFKHERTEIGNNQ